MVEFGVPVRVLVRSRGLVSSSPILRVKIKKEMLPGVVGVSWSHGSQHCVVSRAAEVGSPEICEKFRFSGLTPCLLNWKLWEWGLLVFSQTQQATVMPAHI